MNIGVGAVLAATFIVAGTILYGWIMLMLVPIFILVWAVFYADSKRRDHKHNSVT